MREIKCRAWHGGHEYAEPQMIYDEKPGDCLVWKSQGQNIIQIMQYTGLKDITEKEIYEGDIIKRHSLNLEHTYYYRVEWDEENARYISVAIRGTMRELLSASIEREYVKCGNIYENPELLEANEHA